MTFLFSLFSFIMLTNDIEDIWMDTELIASMFTHRLFFLYISE